ncbi:MAG: hypothetical protein CFH21_00082 [Alphaproteobacteria bacterium MarineAlpha5_Bin11]|nr:MAG: hypothetical protein CFH21_00082 [Alphaproteobacteria bacterium MarineAlpha5_Bin11]PPR51399.1 MAG: hypothetical protein CFH20_00592 [Alphaproteobacteria bacterium MarineAlpha5_Bin10]
MIKIISLIIITLALTYCGTTGPLVLPEGVEDKSLYTYPPKKNDGCEESSEEICEEQQ